MRKEAMFSLTRIRTNIHANIYHVLCCVLHKMQIENLHNSIFYANIFILNDLFFSSRSEYMRSLYWREFIRSLFFIQTIIIMNVVCGAVYANEMLF